MAEFEKNLSRRRDVGGKLEEETDQESNSANNRSRDSDRGEEKLPGSTTAAATPTRVPRAASAGRKKQQQEESPEALGKAFMTMSVKTPTRAQGEKTPRATAGRATVTKRERTPIRRGQQVDEGAEESESGREEETSSERTSDDEEEEGEEKRITTDSDSDDRMTTKSTVPKEAAKVVKIPKTPSCVLCKKHPTTIRGYLEHIRAIHESTFVNCVAKSVSLQCVCGYRVRHEEDERQHVKVCKIRARFALHDEESIRGEDENADTTGSRSGGYQMTPSCFLCDFCPKTMIGYVGHLWKHHDKTKLAKCNKMLQCEDCEFIVRSKRDSEKHSKKCMSREYSLHTCEKTGSEFEEVQATPMCVICKRRPTTISAYIIHLRRHNNSKLHDHGLYLLCSCGVKVTSRSCAEKHSREKCGGFHKFSLHNLDGSLWEQEKVNAEEIDSERDEEESDEETGAADGQSDESLDEEDEIDDHPEMLNDDMNLLDGVGEEIGKEKSVKSENGEEGKTKEGLQLLQSIAIRTLRVLHRSPQFTAEKDAEAEKLSAFPAARLDEIPIKLTVDEHSFVLHFLNDEVIHIDHAELTNDAIAGPIHNPAEEYLRMREVNAHADVLRFFVGVRSLYWMDTGIAVGISMVRKLLTMMCYIANDCTTMAQCETSLEEKTHTDEELSKLANEFRQAHLVDPVKSLMNAAQRNYDTKNAQ